ncbi:MAG: trypsin-like serine protease [Deltaproteobacteria bacterium]|nr:trypsin-like serine protease [Deltaproteobacteria bacterium]
MRIVLAALVAAMAGCVQGPATEEGEAAIVGGQLEAGHPAVGLVTIDAGGGWVSNCTGTLVSDRVLVTAKHCVTESTTPDQVFFEAAGAHAAGTLLVFWPGFRNDDAPPPDDILVVLLDSSIPVEPVPVRREAMGPDQVGEQVLHVGFGDTRLAAYDSGTKRSGPSTIDWVGGNSFWTARADETQATICQGDSGGPVLLNGEVAGVVSATADGCTSAGVHTRVDRYVEAVDLAIQRAGGQ